MHNSAISYDPSTHTLGLPCCLLEQVHENGENSVNKSVHWTKLKLGG